MLYKVIGLLSICLGFLLVATGVDSPISASPNCVQSDYFENTECYGAYAEDRHENNHANMSCTGTYFTCKPSQHSQCGTLEGYQVAMPGECAASTEPSAMGGCWEDSGTTIVVLKYYTSECRFDVFQCKCMLDVNSEHPTQYVETCDCSEDV